MKAVRSFVLLVTCLLPLACRSSASQHEAPCVCGQPMANIEGCAHHKCVSGARNPDNAECVCGSLSIPK